MHRPPLNPSIPAQLGGLGLLHFLKIGVDNVVVILAFLAGSSAATGSSCARTGIPALLALGLGVHQLGQLMRGLGQGLGGALDGSRVLAFHDLFQVLDLPFHVTLGLGINLVAQFL